METARFVLTPYFEIIDVIVPLARLRIDKGTPEDEKGRVEGKQMTEFCVRYDHSLLLSESRRQKNNSFNVRSLIRFCKFDEMRCDKYGIKLKDVFPLHLQINLNNTLVNLPNLLPNDRSGKDGRRFPRPVDLTDVIIDNPIITNRIIINWMQDEAKNEEYYFAIYLARLRPCDELCNILLNQQMSTVSSTLSLVYDQCNNLNGAVDEDLMLVNTSINTSLNCPVSRDRMKIPIRGQNCNHLQCFDCMTYLIINFKKPTWQCPVCDKKTFYCYLEVDGLILNILKDEKSKLVENIQFNNCGQWRPQRKLLGGVEDDQPYYDVINENNPCRSPESKISSSIILNESFSEHKIQEHLRQIFSNQSAYMSTLSNIYHPNMMTSISAANVIPTKSHILKCEADPMNAANNGLPQGPALRDDVINYSSSCSPLQINKTLNNSKFNNLSLPISVPSQYNYNLTQLLRIPPNHPGNLPPSYFNDFQKIPSSPIINDITSRLQITNVISMAQNKKAVKDTIVISDDDQEDTYSIRNDTINTKKKSHKRPTMVSSTPNDICSSKQMKVTNNTNLMFQRPSSVSLNDLPSRFKQLPYLCKCTPDRICPFHFKNMAYINKVMAETYPLDNNDIQTMPSAINDNGQIKMNSNITGLNDNQSNVSFQSSTSNSHIPVKQSNCYINNLSQPINPNIPNLNLLRQPLSLNDTHIYSLPHEPYMINCKMQHAQSGIYSNTLPLNDAQIGIACQPPLSRKCNVQINPIQSAQCGLTNKSIDIPNSSVKKCNPLNSVNQSNLSQVNQIQHHLIRDPNIGISVQPGIQKDIPINKSYQNNINKQIQMEICKERLMSHDFRRDMKLPMSSINPIATNILKQHTSPFSSSLSQTPIFHHSPANYSSKSMMIPPHGLNAENTKPPVFPYNTQHQLHFSQNCQSNFQNSMNSTNFQPNNDKRLPNNISNQIMQQSEITCEPQGYVPSILFHDLYQSNLSVTPTLYQHSPGYPSSLSQHPQMMMPNSKAVSSDLPTTSSFQNMNPLHLPRYPTQLPQSPQMMIPNSKIVSTDLPPSNYFPSFINSHNCNPNYSNMFFNS